MEDVRWPAEQLEEHRLEISNRIRNLFWTVSGDYDMEFEPDTEKYVYSKQTVLYEAVKQGAFARYFDQKKLGMYLMKKLHFSAGEDMLLPLAGLCMDAAVNRFIIRERLGTKEIREQAFRELEKAEEEQVSDKAGTDLIHRIRLLYIRHAEHVAVWLKVPRALGGFERYKNMVLIHKKYLILLQELPQAVTKDLIKTLNITKKMLVKINSLREQANLLAII